MNVNRPSHVCWCKNSKILWLLRTIIQGISRRILKYIGLLDEISKFQTSTGCRGANYFDYLYIYLFIRMFKPRNVLECGSGVTTMIIAMALKRNGGDGKCRSYDQCHEWQKKIINHFPDRYNGYIFFYYSNVTECFHKNIRGIRYEQLEIELYDFIIVDGPDPDPKYDFPLLNMDYLVLSESKVFPKGYICSRLRTGFYYKFLGFRVIVSCLFKCGFILGGRKG